MPTSYSMRGLTSLPPIWTPVEPMARPIAWCGPAGKVLPVMVGFRTSSNIRAWEALRVAQ